MREAVKAWQPFYFQNVFPMLLDLKIIIIIICFDACHEFLPSGDLFRLSTTLFWKNITLNKDSLFLIDQVLLKLYLIQDFSEPIISLCEL